MYWGNSLLWPFDSIMYEIGNLFPRLFFFIWRMLAHLVNIIEGIFRNLAGVGTSEKDVVSEIIKNDHVKDVFNNLVSLSIALIVFFTIVKIIQDHYKDKDGGNPYKIVLRTFKGLLMFFFVSGAVTVGLYASRVMFRALDAATGSGGATIAGQVFKSMASDANRMVIGPQYSGFTRDVYNKFWARLASPGSDQTVDSPYSKMSDEDKDISDDADGKYYIVKVTDQNKATSSKALAVKYLEAFPELQYGVVSEDGTTVVPMVKWLRTMGDKERYDNSGFGDAWYDYGKSQLDYWGHGDGEGGYSDPNNQYDWKDGVNATVGYKNDFLQGVSLSFKPTISLNWSPIDIDNFEYRLVQEPNKNVLKTLTIGFMGNGYQIEINRQNVYFEKGTKVTKSLEDSTKVFGFSVKGSVALQDGDASASFGFEQYSLDSLHIIDDLIKSVCYNVAYTNALEALMDIIPHFPGAFNIGPLGINLVQIFSPVITATVENIVNTCFVPYMPVDEYGEPLAEILVTGSSAHNGGIWSSIKTGSNSFVVSIEQYRIDGNFSELWGQLTGNAKDFIEGLTQTNEAAFEMGKTDMERLNELASLADSQSAVWGEYVGNVESYNENALVALNILGYDLWLWNTLSAFANEEAKNSYLAEHGYKGGVSVLENEIKENWIALVTNYNNYIRKKKPGVSIGGNGQSSRSFADPTILPSIYKPIIEFSIDNDSAEHASVAQIKDYLFGKKTDVNMIFNSDGSVSGINNAGAVYRMVDWDAYGSTYSGNATLKKTADLIDGVFAGNREATFGSVVKENKASDLPIASYVTTNAAIMDAGSVGLSYFIANGPESNDNSFYKHTAKGGNQYNLKKGYWGTKGIVVEGLNEPIAHEELKTRYVLSQKVDQSSNGTSAVTPQNKSELLANLNTSSVDQSKNDEFAKNIIRFRKLGTADGEQNKDINALKSWVKSESALSINGTASKAMLYNLTPQQIDDYMAGTSSEGRNYLLLSKKGKNSIVTDDDAKGSSYIGVFSWSDSSTVDALYDLGHMHLAIGFIAIIAAAGVYMNFAFGLIQRAVNMAVLYIMSPITIAFYPYDDGKKFSSSFVMPFYKEAISAYAVIISLNLFVVLLSPLQKAVESVAGTAMGWLALVAFVSMLPKIRESITSILGAGNLSEKSLTDTVKGFTSTMGKPFSEIKNAGKTVAHGVDSVAGAVRRHRATKDARREDKINKLEAKRKSGNLSWWGERRLNKLQGGQASQQRIDDARKSGDVSGLTKSEQRRLKRQNAAAAAQAKLNTMRQKGESDAAYQARLNTEQNRLLNDTGFKKSVNGVVSASGKRFLSKFGIVGQGLNKGGQWLGEKGKFVGREIENAAGKVGSSLKFAGSWVANSSAVELVRDAASGLRNSVVGEMIANKFGIDGSLAQNKDSFIGSIWRAADGMKRVEDEDKASKIFAKRKQFEYSQAKNLMKALDESSELEKKANENIAEAGRLEAARQQVKNVDLIDKYRDLKKMEYKAKGMNDAEIDAALAGDLAKDKVAMIADYVTLGGDDKYVQGVAKGWNDLSVQLDKNLAEQTIKTMQQTAQNGMKAINDELKKAEAKRKGDIENLVDAFATDMRIDKTNKKKMSDLRNVLKNANNNTSYEDLNRALTNIADGDYVSVNQALGNNYEKFAHDVQFNDNLKQLNLLKGAAKLYDDAGDKRITTIGALADTEQGKAMYQAWMNAHDDDLNSINETSLGYQKNKIIQEKYHGNKDNPDCVRELKQLESSIKGKLAADFDKFLHNNSESIRQFDTRKKFREEMHNLSGIGLLEQAQDERNKLFNALSVEMTDLYVRDSLMQELKLKADYAGAGHKLIELIDAVTQHNDQIIDKLIKEGFDQKSVDKLKNLEAKGDTEKMQNLRRLANFDATHMNNTSDMGGGSLQGVEAILAQLTTVAEISQLKEKFLAALDVAKGQEGTERNRVDYMLENIKTTFNGEMFEGLVASMKDAGFKVNNMDELKSVLEQNLKYANNSQNDEQVKKVLDVMANFKVANKDNLNIVNAVSGYEGAIASAGLAEQKANYINSVNNDISKLNASIAETIKKLGAFGSLGK